MASIIFKGMVEMCALSGSFFFSKEHFCLQARRRSMPGVEHPALKAFLFLTIVLQTFPPATQLQKMDTFFFCIYIVCTRHYDTI